LFVVKGSNLEGEYRNMARKINNVCEIKKNSFGIEADAPQRREKTRAIPHFSASCMGTG
jgi:hypothetical protein